MRVLGLQAVFAAALVSAPLYTVRDAGAPGAASSVAMAIGGNGAIAGEARTITGDRLSFADGATGPMTLAVSATAADVNAGGAVVGTTWTDSGARATVWQNGASTLLDVMDSYSTAINDSGVVAGGGWSGTRTSAFVYSGGAATFIDAGVSASAYDVSNTGQVVGHAEMTSGAFRAFSWTAAGGIRYLGTLGGRYSYAHAVNDSGLVVGSSTNRAGYLHAYLYDGGMVDLGTLGGTTSSAYDVNGRGDAVGFSTDAEGRSRAFVWRNGILFDLNSLIDPASGWTLEAAYGINNRGQIVGAGVWNGRSTAFVLDPLVLTTPPQTMPLEDQIDTIPEPSTMVLLSIGAGVIALRRSSVVSRPTACSRARLRNNASDRAAGVSQRY